MLVYVLAAQRAHFAALAKSWMANGASAFGVWRNDTPLACWPDRQALERPSLVVPITCDGQVLGELRLAGLSSPHARERLLFEAGFIAHLVRLESELNDMTGELVDSQDRLLAVYQLTRSLRNYSTIDETLHGLLFEAMRIVKVNVGFVAFETSSGELMIDQYPAGLTNEVAIRTVFHQAQARERELLLAGGQQLGDLVDGAENLCCIPIRIRGSYSAALALANKIGGFAMSDIKLVRALAELASAHITQVLLHQESLEQRRVQSELDLARRVQVRLLPQQVPARAGLDIYAHSRPARQIGGDFYDFITQPNRALMFAVGDVSGKALSAALLMTMTRTAIHSKASYMPNPSPELVMRNSNEDLFDDFLQVGMFSTAFIGQYQATSRSMLYANAGHSPVIYCPAGGEPRMLNADSPPLGVLNPSLCRNHSVRLERGDVLVVATDGFNEARSPDESMFGTDRLLNLVAISSDMPARAIGEIMLTAVDAFSLGRPQDDDQTLVVIKGVAE